MKEALFYKRENNLIHCYLCPHNCKLKEGELGRCRVRKAEEEKLYSINYGKLSAINVDPIEKKPLYRFMGGTYTLSVGSYGCNMKCSFCQNHHISMEIPETVEVKPSQLVETAIKQQLPSISYTYNEPIIYYEYVLETARLAKDRGIKNIMVTNGFIEMEALEQLIPFIDAFNIDLKAFKKESYLALGGRLDKVKDSIKAVTKDKHLEVTTLVVTGLNDNLDEMESMVKWLASVNDKIPLHISRCFPRYRYNEGATKLEILHNLKNIAEKYLEYVYLGNV